MYSILAKNIMAPAMDLLRGARTMQYSKELEKSQWWPQAKIIELQNERLRKLIDHAYRNVPYFHRILVERSLRPSDILGREDLVKLPILTKKLIRRNNKSLMAKGPFSKKALPNSTSGSTGEPLKFFSTKDDMYNWGFAAEQRALRWAGYEIGNRCIHIGRKGLEHSKIAIYRDKAGQFFERVMPLDAKKISSSNAAALVKKVEDFHPEVIRGITNAIYILARLLQKENTSSIRLKTVITTGEQLQDYQRDLFQKVFDCETFNHYGSWEFHAIAAECERHSGFHIAAENVIVEVVDEKDLPLPPGKEGRILVTGLHNYAMPFIRYEIGDIGALSDQLCPCGRGLPILASLGGRSADIILTRSGIMVSGLNLPKRFFADMDVEQYQIEQESYERIIVKIVLEPGCPRGRPEEISSEIEKRWRPILGKEIDIVPDFVDEIPSTASGKRRVVVSRIPSTGVQDPKSM